MAAMTGMSLLLVDLFIYLFILQITVKTIERLAVFNVLTLPGRVQLLTLPSVYIQLLHSDNRQRALAVCWIRRDCCAP